MRFRGTLALVGVCALMGGYLYFYEIKGGEKREKAKQEENRLWKFESTNIRQIDLTLPSGQINVQRTGEREWKITAPRSMEADADELNRLAASAADVSRESVVEPHASDLSRFGLNPAQVTLGIKTKDGKAKKIRFGNNNPTGSSTYAAMDGSDEVFLVASSVASSFQKKLEDLRNHSILTFEQFETQALDLATSKGSVQLAKENDKWWLQGKEKLPADTSAVNGILGALSGGRIKEFFDGNPEDYANLGFDKPLADVRLVVGKDRAIKHLMVGAEKSKLVKKGEKPKPADKTAPASGELYLAKDESRTELFFVDKELVEKIGKSSAELRDKALASMQRWEIDSIALTNVKGSFTFTKAGGDWVVGSEKKKAKWDAVNGILDAVEKPVKQFIDNPSSTASYGFDKPVVHIVLKQGADVKVDCVLGKETADGVYAQVKGTSSSVAVADREILEKLNQAESDFLEPPAAAAAPAKK